jgi:phosphatidate cytidylyltransferase
MYAEGDAAAAPTPPFDGATSQIPAVNGAPPDGESPAPRRAAPDGESPSSRRAKGGKRRAGRGASGTPDNVDPPKASRAGRNLPAAIGVGSGLGAAVLVSLLFWKPAFFFLIVVAACVGTWEMVRAVKERARPPMIPLLVGAPLILGLAWYGGAETITLGLVATVLAMVAWRFGDGVEHFQRDVTVGVFIAVYVPFLAAFVALLVRSDDGVMRILATLIAVVLSDTGGYASGVFFGKHWMAPTVSPKKSWEGFAGSLVITALGSAIVLHFMLHDHGWWRGAVFGLAVSAASVLGDLAESMIKRDLGIKDMSNLLPGHGGLMDRLDSILLAAPAAYAVLALLLPPA